MDTLIALVAASFLTAQSSDFNMPDQNGETYTIKTQSGADYTLTIRGAVYDFPGSTEGELVASDGNFPMSGDWEFDSGVLTEFSVLLMGDDSDTWTHDCQNGWPVIEVGETVSDPCWMTSTTGTPIEVTRTG